MNQEEQGRKMSQLIARCWADAGFKQKLLADPAATLKAEGAEIPAGLSIKALENTDKVFHLVIPARPTALSDADLDKVVGGVKAMPVGTSGAPPVTLEPWDPNSVPGTAGADFTIDDWWRGQEDRWGGRAGGGRDG